MHVTGKILIFFLIGAAICAFVFAGRLVESRGKWMRQVQDARAKNEKTADALPAARLARDQARSDLQREMLRWDRFWTDVSANFNPQANTLVSTAGGTAGIPANTTLYAFELTGKGSVYVGSFGVSQVQPNQSLLKAAFRVREEDIPKWTEGNWRLRTVIPSAYASRIADLQSRLIEDDERLAKQRSNLEIQNQLVEAAKEQREDRIGELLGGRKAAPGDEGLVARITKADDQRNESLAEVDRLRRAVREGKQKVDGLIRENSDLAGRIMGSSGLKQQAAATPPSF